MRITKAEQYAFAHAKAAMRGLADPNLALMAACRAFRDAMPPRKEIASDRLPDHAAGGQAARKVIDAGSNGMLRQPIEEIMVMAGRALIEKAIPSPKARKAKGLPDYEAVGRAADAVYNRMSRRKRPAPDDEVEMAMGRAGIQVAWRGTKG